MKLFNSLTTIAPLIALTSFVCAQEAAPKADDQPEGLKQQQPQENASDEKKKDDKEQSLDDLLGIEGSEEDKSAAEAAAADVDAELKRQLTEEEIRNAFEQAVAKMVISADLLDQRFDTGLGTQRVQEDIIAKLDQLIDAAKKSNSRSKSSSSSSSSSQQQQSSANSQQNAGRRPQNQNQQANANQRQNSGESREGDPPPMQEGDVNTVFEESRSEWGNLPQRVRDLIVQGRQGRYSSLYQDFTAEYYKRLAEEGSP